MQLVAALALTASAMAASPVGKYFDNYIFIIMENNDMQYVLKNPKYASLISQGVEFTNYHATVHPSQPNYWSTIAQSTFRGLIDAKSKKPIDQDSGDNTFNVTGAPMIADSLEAAGLDWAIYSENYPGNATYCFTDDGAGTEANVTDATKPEFSFDHKGAMNRLYKRKHNPFVSFDSIYNNAARCGAHVKDVERDWAGAVAADVFPEYSYIVPNQVDDAHDFSGDNEDGTQSESDKVGIEYSAAWLIKVLGQIQNSTYLNNRRTLVHITFDENDLAYALHYSQNKSINSTCTDLVSNCPGDKSNNQVYGLLLGSAVSCFKNSTIDGLFDHNSIVSTLVDNWSLAPLSYGDKTPVWPLQSCSFPQTYKPAAQTQLYSAASKAVIGAFVAAAVALLF